MAINRRNLLIGLSALGASPTSLTAQNARPHPRFVAAARRPDGTYSAAIFHPDGQEISHIPLPGRGHDITINPRTRDCVVFARRPGTFAIAFSKDNNKPPIHFSARTGRHFYGHGVFSPDGRLLFSTENDFENSRGVIGVRDPARGFKQISEFPSGGIGPHDLALLSDGRTLVVANGGIATHLRYGRLPLNLPTMSPSLSYIDLQTGKTLETQNLGPKLHQLSIRHLTITPDDQVFFACQYKGRDAGRPQLIGTHRRGEKLDLLDLPAGSIHRLQNYIGSIEASSDGRILLATSPRGGTVLAIDIKTRQLVAQHMMKDVSGIAPATHPAAFLLTSGRGAIANYRATSPGTNSPLPLVQTDNQWDNHLAAF